MFSSELVEDYTMKKFMWQNMVQTEYRDEQLLATDILKIYFPKDQYSVRQEEPVEECKAILDIAIIPKDKVLKRIAIRLMGEIHLKPYKVIRDEDQEILLKKHGWRVFDFWYDRMEGLWSLNIEEAGREIRRELLF